MHFTRLLTLQRKYQRNTFWIQWLIKAILFYLVVGAMLLGFYQRDASHQPATAVFKLEISLFLLKAMNAFTLFILCMIACVALIGKLLSFLTGILLAWLPILSRIRTKKTRITPLQSIIGILVASHIAYAILLVVIYTY